MIYDEPRGLEEFFEAGMARVIPSYMRPVGRGRKLNLGAGNKSIDGYEPIGLEQGEDFDEDSLPAGTGTVTAIAAFHVLEHLENPVHLLRECQRVLSPGGVMSIVVPYGTSHLALQDIDHRQLFNEDTWKTLFDNDYYNRYGEWHFRVGLNIIMGLTGQNLALFTQLLRKNDV